MIKNKKTLFQHLGVTVILAALMIGLVPQLSNAQSVSDLQRQIDAVNREISASQSRVAELRKRADTLENRLALLNAEAEQIQREIDVTEREITRTRGEIAQKEAELQRTKELIQENVKVLYKEGNPSTLEMLFSSDNFTDFVNRQEYLNKVKDSLNKAARESVLIKQELEEKEVELGQKSDRLNGQRQQLALRQQEQRQLIEQTRGEEARYQQLVSNQQAELERLEQLQRAAYARMEAEARRSGQFVATNGTGNYPWDDKPYPCWSANCVDPWGLYYGECVSYTAWKVADSGRFVPHFNGQGHAKQWPATTSSYGIPNGSTPKVGSVAIDMYIGAYGHSMYVEEVLSGNRIRVSEYNVIPGAYSERIIDARGLVYIYF